MDKSKYGSLLHETLILSEKASEGGNTATNMDPETEPESQPPLTFADMGIPTPSQLQDTMIGKTRPLSDVTWKERCYIVAMLLSIAAASVFTLYRVATVGRHDTDFTFGLVLLFNAVVCAWFVIEGVLRERPSELFILNLATVLILVYLIVNYSAGKQNDVKLARLIVACVCCPPLVGLGLHIAWEYHTSKHLIFRTVGANEHLQTLYRNLLLFQDLLKFDLELGGSMIILIVVSPVNVKTKDIVILSVGGAVTLVWFVLGYFSMPRESKPGAIIFFLFSPAELAYIIYKLYDVSHYAHSHPGLADATIACGAAAIVARITVIISGIVVVRAFRSSLKEKLYGQQDLN